MEKRKIKHIEVIKLDSEEEIAKEVAAKFIDKIEAKPSAKFILATGSSPIKTYENIIKDHKENGTDWSKTIVCNLDEYVGLKPTDKQSYRYFMNNKLFNHINININSTHLPSGIDEPKLSAKNYDMQLEMNSPFDITLLGVGVNGHIAFNEPGSEFDAKTAEVTLTKETIEANKKYFKSLGDVPKTAISVGIGTILTKSNEIILIALGASKQAAITELLKGKENLDWPITALLRHSKVTVYTDCKIK